MSSQAVCVEVKAATCCSSPISSSFCEVMAAMPSSFREYKNLISWALATKRRAPLKRRRGLIMNTNQSEPRPSVMIRIIFCAVLLMMPMAWG